VLTKIRTVIKTEVAVRVDGLSVAGFTLLVFEQMFERRAPNRGVCRGTVRLFEQHGGTGVAARPS
jgi:hypothetical protein